MTFLLTGASGFVGNAVMKAALQRRLKIRPVYRSTALPYDIPEAVQILDLNESVDWLQVLNGVEVVIHTAGRAHILREEALVPLVEYRRVNVEGTLNLARQAAASGVRRFVFISSIKVNGESTVVGCPFTADDTPSPKDAYSISKAEAESQLKRMVQETGMEVTIIRPPLIYGPGVKGNFARLVNLVRQGIPLPLGAITHNRRSLVGLDNLVDLILVCADHPKAANQTFLVCDGEDLSLTDLLKKIGKAVGKSDRLLWVPAELISFMATLVGKQNISERLLGSLQVDMTKTCELLNWKPSVAVDEGLRRTVKKIEC
jgi:nucleoside-diphosphate-sugar epimerase